MVPVEEMQNALIIALIKKYGVKEITITDADIVDLPKSNLISIYKKYDIENSSYTFTIETA